MSWRNTVHGRRKIQQIHAVSNTKRTFYLLSEKDSLMIKSAFDRIAFIWNQADLPSALFKSFQRPGILLFSETNFVKYRQIVLENVFRNLLPSYT